MGFDPSPLMTDARLSDSARVLGFYIASLGEGEHELSHDELAALLHGCPNTDTVGRHMRMLIVHRYVERTSPGGRGSPRYRWLSTLEKSRAESQPAKNHGENGSMPANFRGESRPPTTTPTTPPTPTEARERERPAEIDLARLRSYLGEHSRAVDLMLASSDHPPTWAASVFGKYGSNGTQAPSGIPPDRRPAVLANALMDFAGKGKPYNNRYFDGFFNRALDDERNGHNHRNGSGAPGAAAAGGGTAAKPDPNAKFRSREISGDGRREAV